MAVRQHETQKAVDFFCASSPRPRINLSIDGSMRWVRYAQFPEGRVDHCNLFGRIAPSLIAYHAGLEWACATRRRGGLLQSESVQRGSGLIGMRDQSACILHTVRQELDPHRVRSEVSATKVSQPRLRDDTCRIRIGPASCGSNSSNSYRRPCGADLKGSLTLLIGR